MNIPENNPNVEPNPKKNGIFNILLFIFLFLAVIVISFLVYLKSQNIAVENISLKDFFKSTFSFGNKEDKEVKTWEIEYDYGEHPVFAAYNGLLVKCFKGSITGLDTNGEEKWAVPVSANNPVLKVAGSSLVLGDLDGREIYVFDGRNIKWNKKIDNNIINIDINDEGYVSVLHEVKGYRGKVTVFNRNGSEVVSRTVSDTFPLLSKVSPTDGKFVINSLNTSGIKASTLLTFASMDNESVKKVAPQQDVLFPFSWYLDNGLLVCVSDSSIVSFDSDANEKWKYEFNDRKIYCSEILQGRYVVVAASGTDKNGNADNGNTAIEIYSKGGEKTAEFSVEGKVKNIKTFGDVIGINTGREVYFTNSKGKLLDKYTSKADISEMIFINRQEAAFVTKGKVIISQIL